MVANKLLKTKIKARKNGQKENALDAFQKQVASRWSSLGLLLLTVLVQTPQAAEHVLSK